MSPTVLPKSFVMFRNGGGDVYAHVGVFTLNTGSPHNEGVKLSRRLDLKHPRPDR
jgi:hypothetical protein